MLRLYYCKISDFCGEFFSSSDMDLLSRRELDRLRSLCGRMLAKKLLSELSGLPEEALIFDTAPGGKPILKNTDLFFNISHSGEWAVCVGGDSEVGIDLQQIKPVSPALARGVGSLRERLLFGSKCPDPDAINENKELLIRWYQLWCGKEALGKYTGNGLSRELLQTDLRQRLEELDLRMWEFSPQEGYLCAVVATEPVAEIRRIFPKEG